MSYQVIVVLSFFEKKKSIFSVNSYLFFHFHLKFFKNFIIKFYSSITIVNNEDSEIRNIKNNINSNNNINKEYKHHKLEKK